MFRDRCPAKISHAACAVAFMIGSSLATAEPGQQAINPSLAGQMCPSGSFVIGFDASGNIVCNAPCSNGVVNAGEACDDGNRLAGDGCSATCQSEVADAGVRHAADAAVYATAATAATADMVVTVSDSDLVISDVEPSSVLYGTGELTITVTGTGFGTAPLIEFAGTTYTPSVNPEGTRLQATIATRSLTMGTYAITVSNGSELKATRKKALVVY